MSAKYVRDYYRVPAKKGGRIRFSWSGWHGTPEGTIMSFPGQYLRVRMDDGSVFLLHPTWMVEYLDAPQ